MAYKKSVFRSFLLISHLGFSILSPIILCMWIAAWIEKAFNINISLFAILLGLASGLLMAYKAILKYLDAQRREDAELKMSKAEEMVRAAKLSPKQKSRVFGEDEYDK